MQTNFGDASVLTREEAVEKIRSSGNLVWGCTFRKRTTGEIRSGSFRLGVKAHLKGGSPAYDFASKGLIPCYDMNKHAYRSICIEGIIRVVIDGQVYIVRDKNERERNMEVDSQL